MTEVSKVNFSVSVSQYEANRLLLIKVSNHGGGKVPLLTWFPESPVTRADFTARVGWYLVKRSV